MIHYRMHQQQSDTNDEKYVCQYTSSQDKTQNHYKIHIYNNKQSSFCILFRIILKEIKTEQGRIKLFKIDSKDIYNNYKNNLKKNASWIPHVLSSKTVFNIDNNKSF